MVNVCKTFKNFIGLFPKNITSLKTAVKLKPKITAPIRKLKTLISSQKLKMLANRKSNAITLPVGAKAAGIQKKELTILARLKT